MMRVCFKSSRRWSAGLLLFTLLSCPAMGQSADDMAALRAELSAMRAELAEVRAVQGVPWQDAARREEVRAVVEDVMRDASSRTAFADNTAGGGHDGKNFYLAGEGFLMKFSGHLQARYIANFDSDRDAGGEGELLSGFELRRAKLQFEGHIADPKLTYLMRLSASRSGGGETLEEAWVGYTFDNGIKLTLGRLKLPFAKQELISIKYQLAVDRGLSTEFFTLNFSEMARLDASLGERWQVNAAFSDGGNRDSTAATDDTVDYAVTGRAEYLVVGDWKQGKNVLAFDDEPALIVGGAVHAESPSGSAEPTLAWTADALFKQGGFSLLGAYYGATGTVGTATDTLTQTGLLAEAGYAISKQWQPFVRYDYIDSDEAGLDPLQAVTAGVNYFLKGHQAKLTLDTVVLLTDDNPSAVNGLAGAEFSSGVGTNAGGTQRDQVVLRAQMQLMF